MKNQTLAYHLLPTEDASILHLEKGRGIVSDILNLYHKSIESNKIAKAHHLYLTSDAPIKGDSFIVNDKVYKCVGLHKVSGDIESDNGLCYDITKCKKIILTTDPKLIADGVPAIDGNTKAWRVSHILEGSVKPEVLKEVNFLTEFCKRYNQKDNQKVDVEKLVFDLLNKHLPKDTKWKIETERGVQNAMKEIYNQALQSQAGGFSLEDMRKCFFEGFSYDNFGVPDNRDKYFNDFIQSLTKETPKGDIVIELNEGNLIFK